MGIQGLLPLMKSIMVPIHIKDLQGRSVAVDTYSWLHKGALSCSKDLCMGLPTSRHIDYCMYRVNLLRHYGIKPILVFDGGLLPMKGDEENKRLRARKENLERAIEHESTGNSAAAYECYQKAVEISPSVAFKLIQVLKEENVDYIVAPYEADAQMAFLSLRKHVDAVITEDSDLIPFGCSRIIFKMDKFGQGVEFQYSAIQRNKDLNFTSFTKQMLLEMCILSGCDYLQSLPGMGLKRSHALLLKFKSCDKVIKHLRYNGISVPPSYEETFKKAVLTFQHQRVYDPMTEDIVHLTSIPDDISFELDFLGPLIPQSVVKGIAKGDLDPLTKLPFQDALSHSVCHKNYPVKEFKPEHRRKQLDSSAQDNLLTNYFCLASVEAKRKFKIPRIMPKNLKLIEESSPFMTRGRSHGADLSCVVEAVSCSVNCSQESVPASGNAQNDLSFKDSVDNAFTINDSQHLELTPRGKVDENVNDIITHVNCSGHDGTFQQSYHDVVEPSRPLGKSKSSYAVEVIDGRTGERKVTVRSSYFKHNLLDENVHGNAGEKLIPEEENLNVVFCGHMETKSFSVVNDHVETSIVKRRSISAQAQSNQSGIVEVNSAVMNAIHSTDDTKDGKFGCDVSHLNRYSDIAEKSMERFVSAISSFRYKASGSRASGLRAPLKDVQNTCAVRSATMPIDLSKFRYIPKKKKTASAS